MYNKYVPKASKLQSTPGKQGRYVNPDHWITGPDPLTREKYYAWLKHRSQARYRKEEYSITWEEWQQLWSDEDFLKRGRSPSHLCLLKIKIEEGWHVNNVTVVARRSQFKRTGEYRKRD